jgi:hypothetical protein
MVVNEYGCDVDTEYWCEYYKNCRPINWVGDEDCIHGCKIATSPETQTVWCEKLQRCITRDEICEQIQQPECTPVADKPYRCGGGITGTNSYDRYDCINGTITLTEHDSTSCGFQVPEIPEPVETPSISTPVLVGLAGIALVGGLIIVLRRDG